MYILFRAIFLFLVNVDGVFGYFLFISPAEDYGKWDDKQQHKESQGAYQ